MSLDFLLPIASKAYMADELAPSMIDQRIGITMAISFVATLLFEVLHRAAPSSGFLRWCYVLVGLVFFLSLVAGGVQLAVSILAIGMVPALALALSPNAFVPAVTIALGMYWLRGRHPLIYGLVEVAAALVAIWTSTHGSPEDAAGHLVTVLAGIYFLVRGLDNMERGLPEKLRPAWIRVFPKQAATRAAETAPRPDPSNRSAA